MGQMVSNGWLLTRRLFLTTNVEVSMVCKSAVKLSTLSNDSHKIAHWSLRTDNNVQLMSKDEHSADGSLHTRCSPYNLFLFHLGRPVVLQVTVCCRQHNTAVC